MLVVHAKSETISLVKRLPAVKFTHFYLTCETLFNDNASLLQPNNSRHFDKNVKKKGKFKFLTDFNSFNLVRVKMLNIDHVIFN